MDSGHFKLIARVLKETKPSDKLLFPEFYRQWAATVFAFCSEFCQLDTFNEADFRDDCGFSDNH